MLTRAQDAPLRPGRGPRQCEVAQPHPAIEGNGRERPPFSEEHRRADGQSCLLSAVVKLLYGQDVSL
jgi:hypothetical protein